MRKHATTIVLGVLTAALALWLWLGDRGSVTDTERDLRARNVFPAFRRDDIARVEIENPTGRWVITRPLADGGPDAFWTFEEPAKERTDDHAVDTLLGAFEFATRVRKADSASGLDHPRAKGSIAMGKVTFRFELGDPAPTPEGAAYLRVEGEGTFVVGSELVKALLQPWDALRSRTVVPYLSLEIARLEIAGKDGAGFAMDRIDDVAFRLPALGVRASRERLDGVWLALAELRAESFLSDADADRAVASPQVTVTMTPRDPKKPRGELVIGGPCPSADAGGPSVAVVRRAPTRLSACVPAGAAARLVVSPAELADRRLFLARPDEVESITLAATPTGLTVDLARKGTGWQLRAPEGRELAKDEADMATALVGAVVHSEAASFRPRAPADDALALRARVTLTRSEPPGDETVELFVGADKKAYASRKDDGAIAEVGPDVARRLAPSLVAIRGRAVWAPPVEGLAQTSLTLDCDGTRQELARDALGWRMIAPAGYPADHAAGDVADAIARLRADAWVAESDDGTFGLDGKCTLALAAGADGGARAVRLELGKDEGSGLYARANGAGPVFVVSRAMRDHATRLLVDRAAVSVDTNRAERVVLRKGASALVLGRAAGRLAPDGGPPSAGAAADALVTLKADDVVHLGPPKDDEGFAAPALELRATYGGDGGPREVTITFGRVGLRREQKMYFARVSGVAATFAVAKERVEPLLDPL